MASPELAPIIAAMRANPYTADKSVELLRQESGEGARARPLPEGATCEEVDAGGVPSEWVRMPESRPDRIFLMIHGGGYYRGLAAAVGGASAWIARAAKCTVLSINYRRAPEHPFPAAVDDTITAYRWLLSQGFAADHIVVGGISAGGGLTLALLLSCRDSGDPLPAGGVPMSAWTDLAQTGGSFQSNADADPAVSKEYLDRFSALYLNGTDPQTPLASPLYADLTGLPPLLLQVGTTETMLDDSVAFAARAEEAGVDVTLEQWPEMIHGWQQRPHELPEAREAIEHIAEFYRHVVEGDRRVHGHRSGPGPFSQG